MTKEEIDILWHKAMRLSIEDGDQFTRYRFAELVAEAEREACAKVCEELDIEGWRDAGWDMGTIDCAAAIRARSNK